MRIGFDGKRVVQNFTGLGNYSRFILNLLQKHYPQNEYWVYVAKKSSLKLGVDNNINFRTKSQLIFNWLWRSFSIVKDLKRDKISLYHGLSNELPFGISSSGIPSVVTMHDLIFLRFPQFYSSIDRFIYLNKFKYACKNADQVIAVSEQTKQDIVTYFKVNPNKIEVIYQGCNSIFKLKVSDEEKQKIRQKYSLPHHYLLQVGTIEERKNLLLTVKSLNSVAQEIKLVVIGRETDYVAEVREYMDEFNLKPRVKFLANVPVEDLPAIYQQAKLFVYPSEFEGFGIPIIEALNSGIPVIAATGSCLEEAGGPDSCYVHPKDDIQLAFTINSLINDQDKCDKMVEAGYRYVKKFDDAQLSEKLFNIYTKVLNYA